MKQFQGSIQFDPAGDDVMQRLSQHSCSFNIRKTAQSGGEYLYGFGLTLWCDNRYCVVRMAVHPHSVHVNRLGMTKWKLIRRDLTTAIPSLPIHLNYFRPFITIDKTAFGRSCEKSANWEAMKWNLWKMHAETDKMGIKYKKQEASFLFNSAILWIVCSLSVTITTIL